MDSTAGAVLAPALGNTLTINGTISARMMQIFSGAGTVLLSPTNIPEVYPQWFGVTYSGSDESAALQAAINSLGSIGTFRGGRLRITGTIGIANTITIWNKNIEIAGCGWADFDHVTQPCGVKWVATSDSSTKDMFQFISNAGIWMHDIRFEGNAKRPVQSVLGFTTNGKQIGAQQFDHFERIAIGPYPSGTVAGFKYGVYVYGDNSNNDSMEWDNVVIAGASDSDIYIAQSQSQIWSMHNIGMFGAGVAGIKTAGSVDIIGASFGLNTTDFILVKDLRGQIPLVRLFIDDLASEGSARFMNFEGNGNLSAIPDVVIINSRWGFGNGNTPPDDGGCGPGTGRYAHCTRIWDGRNTSFTLRIMNFCIDEGGYAGAQFPIIDFSNSGSAWSVNAEMDWSADCGDQSSNFLLGSANNGTDDLEHFHYRYMGHTGSSHPAEWNYEAGAAFGNAAYFIPQPGVIMRRSMLNGTGGSQTCSGTCILDLTRGMVQVFKITGNVTSWTVPNINSFPHTGLDRISIWICASGGNYTASAPLMASSNPIKNWGFTATINDGTCAHQDIEFNGFGGSVSSPLTTSYYGVRFENGITP